MVSDLGKLLLGKLSQPEQTLLCSKDQYGITVQAGDFVHKMKPFAGLSLSWHRETPTNGSV
jgi:hypothetical protein